MATTNKPGRARVSKETPVDPGAKVLPSFVSHGTPIAYINYWCRCEPCREAHSLYESQRRARNSEKYTTHMREYMCKYRERNRNERAVPCSECGEKPGTILMGDGERYCTECAELLVFRGLGPHRMMKKERLKGRLGLLGKAAGRNSKAEAAMGCKSLEMDGSGSPNY